MMLTSIKPGSSLTRREVHERFGGRQQGGVAPSRKVRAVLFFSDPVKGARHGYYDGWDADGLYEYAGEGQRGDQTFTQGNKAILLHREEGRSLEGFQGTGATVTYLGGFELHDYYLRDAQETNDPSTLRQVIVFRLRLLSPREVPSPSTPVTPPRQASIQTVSVEEQHTERAFITPNREPHDAERREASLVLRYQRHLLRQGHTVSRLRVVPKDEGVPLYSDLWDETAQELIEAKGGVTREHVRMAVGQLLDYGRFVNAKQKTVLLPSRPRPDLISYLNAINIAVVYPNGDDWGRELGSVGAPNGHS